MEKYFRIKLDENQYNILCQLLWNNSLLDEIKKNTKIITINSKKKHRAQKASQAKIKQSKEKIQNAINLLRLQGKTINPYSVSQVAGISYSTARKYLLQNTNKI